MNPKFKTDDIINTLHNIVGPIQQKYPEKLILVKTMGDSEEAYIYKLNY